MPLSPSLRREIESIVEERTNSAQESLRAASEQFIEERLDLIAGQLFKELEKSGLGFLNPAAKNILESGLNYSKTQLYSTFLEGLKKYSD